MKISEIIIEEGPQGTVGPTKPTGSTIAPVKRKIPLNPFGGNKQLQNTGQSLLNTADQNTEQGPDKAEQSNKTKFEYSLGTTIKTGTIDPNLEQSGKDYAKELQGQLDKAQQPRPKVNQVQDRVSK